MQNVALYDEGTILEGTGIEAKEEERPITSIVGNSKM